MQQTRWMDDINVEEPPVGLPVPVRAKMLSVIIPAWNEEDGIADIIARIQRCENALKEIGMEHLEIIVVDDGSRDRTAEIVKSLPDVRLVRHSENRGYGAAIKTGFSRAQGEFLAFLDADSTYPPEHFALLCQAVVDREADLVVGSRRSGERSEMPTMRRLGNLLWANLVSFIGEQDLSDPASGMRVMRRSVLPRLYPLPDGLNFTPVMSTRAVHESLRVLEISIPYHERSGRSKLSILRDGTRFLATIIETSLEYNPVRIFASAGGAAVAAACLIGAALIVLRIQGVQQLGTWGVFSVFIALILGVAGISILSLGITFDHLVVLFNPKSPSRPNRFVRFWKLQQQFIWLGPTAGIFGTVLAVSSLVLSLQGWEAERLWLWLLGSALFILVGLQMFLSSVLTRVLDAISEREVRIGKDLFRSI